MIYYLIISYKFNLCPQNTEVSKSCQTITIANTTGHDRGRYTLTFDTEEEAAAWQAALTRHVADHRLWGVAAEEEMEILTPQPTRHNFLVPRRGRFASLYEETPLRGTLPCNKNYS